MTSRKASCRPRSFNPRTRKGATAAPGGSRGAKVVSVHAPARVRPPGSISGIGCASFNPRTRKGATSGSGASARSMRRFNPRTRKGATGEYRTAPGVDPVSIHAPARVRPSLFWTRRYSDSFNPRTRKGATSPRYGRAGMTTFQSTHPQGCDVGHDVDVVEGGCFNPRTRKGATVSACPHRRSHSSFNPRTRKGATAVARLATLRGYVSIHAPARVRPTPS